MPLRVCLLCAFFLIIVCCQPSHGQNPFGGSPDGDLFGGSTAPAGNNPFGAADSTADNGFGGFGMPDPADPGPVTPVDNTLDTSAEEEKDPVIRLLRESPPTTLSDMAQALTWVSRLKRWDEAGRLLDRLQSLDWDLPMKAGLAREGGNALWIRLRSKEVELTDQQRALVGEILTAPANLARDAKWIDSWIDKLGSESPSTRRLAMLRLQDGGLESISRLLERLLDGDPRVAPVMLAGTLTEFGDDGKDALRAACQLRDAARSNRVLLALAELPGQDFAAELGAALVSPNTEASTRSKLAQILSQRFGVLPTESSVQAFLHKQFGTALSNYQQARTSGPSLPKLVWRTTPEGRSIQASEAAADARELERLAQLAALRLQLGQLGQSTAIESGVALLQRAYQVNPQLSLGEIENSLLTDLTKRDFSLSGYWRSVFELADEWQMHGAALRGLQLLATNRGEALEQINFLSDVLSDPRPMIRYSALQAIDEIDPTFDYRGKDKAITTALEMAKLETGPHALVIGLQSHLRQAAAQQIRLHTSADVTSVNSAQSALLTLDGNLPIELIFVVDRVADQSLFELIQRIRHSRKGHAIPIAVLTERLYSYERDLIGSLPGVVSSVLSRNADNMSRVIDTMLQELDTQPLTPADRLAFSKVGSGLLARIAGNRDRYHFYHISDFHEKLVSTAVGLNAPTQTSLLSGLGTAGSQQRLFQLASENSMSQTDRSAAANAFSDSVRRFGLRLDRTSVANCYELYNRLGPQDAVAVKTLGFCLDVIEAQAGKADWPERL